MLRPKVSYSTIDPRIPDLIKTTDHKILAQWAYDCALRVLPYFEAKYPTDPRPRQALNTLQNWINTGIFKMSVIRKASLDSHTAARAADDKSAAHAAARACGQAVATAHVKTHAPGAAIYAILAIYAASTPQTAKNNVETERLWQYQHLLKLKN